MNNHDHRLGQVTLPGLSFAKREIAYVKVLSAMVTSVRNDEPDSGNKPATVMKVLNLQDQMEYRLICPALLVSSLTDEGEDYVGKCYEIQVPKDILPGKRYKACQVYEILPDLDYSDYPTTFDKVDSDGSAQA